MREQIPLYALFPLRLFAGYALLRAALGKLANHWLTDPTLAAILGGWLHDNKPPPFYASFLRSTVIPHATLFSWLVVGGELAVGAALLLGLFTRPAALAGGVLTLNFFLGQGETLGGNVTSAFLFVMLTLLLTAPGRTLGIDAILRGRVPRWLS